jgi:hypothetical protein
MFCPRVASNSLALQSHPVKPSQTTLWRFTVTWSQDSWENKVGHYGAEILASAEVSREAHIQRDL